jgi:hypothetical protein
MNKPLEAARKAVFDEIGSFWPADRVARATVLAYLRALVERGPSIAVLDAGLDCHDWTPSEIWPAMLAAHIKTLEDDK